MITFQRWTSAFFDIHTDFFEEKHILLFILALLQTLKQNALKTALENKKSFFINMSYNCFLQLSLGQPTQAVKIVALKCTGSKNETYHEEENMRRRKVVWINGCGHALAKSWRYLHRSFPDHFGPLKAGQDLVPVRTSKEFSFSG